MICAECRTEFDPSTYATGGRTKGKVETRKFCSRACQIASCKRNWIFSIRLARAKAMTRKLMESREQS